MQQSAITDHQSGGDRPWRDKQRLKELYVEEGLSAREVGEILRCSHTTVLNHLREYGLERHPKHNRGNSALFHTRQKDGYERWVASDGARGAEYVHVHRLVAVAEHGIDALDGKDVHHKNGVPWDNRPDNLELLTRAEHLSQHAVEKELEIQPSGSFGAYTDEDRSD